MRLIDVYLQDDFTACQACGHDIKWRYIVQNGASRMTIGSECAITLLGPEAANLNRRAKRAAAQWRKQEPKPLDSETREQYIARRMAEMTNARRAYNAALAFWSRHDLYRYARKVNNRACRMFRVRPTDEYRIADQPFDRMDIRDRVISRIERRYHANRYDFDCRRPWDVAKI